MFPMMKEIKNYITTRFESRLNYISKEEFTFFEEKAKEDSSIQTFQIDEEAFLYLNFNEMPQPSLRELEKMVKEITSCRGKRRGRKRDRPAARYATG